MEQSSVRIPTGDQWHDVKGMRPHVGIADLAS